MEHGAESVEMENQTRFRFESLEIWQRAAASTTSLFALAEKLDAKKFYRFAEQLRAATLSITNNPETVTSTKKTPIRCLKSWSSRAKCSSLSVAH